MLTRGQNLIGYHHYSRDIVNRFIKAAHRNGIDVFRVFDALNDVRNVIDSAEALNECGAHFEGAISYTMSPCTRLDSYIEYGLSSGTGRQVHLHQGHGRHAHAVPHGASGQGPQPGGRPARSRALSLRGRHGPANIIKAAEAGASIVDTAPSALAFGNSQARRRDDRGSLKESEYDTDLGPRPALRNLEYWEEMRIKKGFKRGILDALAHARLLPSGSRWHDVQPREPA